MRAFATLSGVGLARYLAEPGAAHNHLGGRMNASISWSVELPLGVRIGGQQFATKICQLPLIMSWHIDLPGCSLTSDATSAREAWRRRFDTANRPIDPSFDIPHHARITRRTARLRTCFPRQGCRFDGPFVQADVLKANACPDGLPYAAFRPDLLWWHLAVLDFANLVRDWCVAPSAWKAANVVIIWKKGDRKMPGNYRPIALTSGFANLFERLLLQRIGPAVVPQLDDCQAGFLWGSGEQAYVLSETLRLRAGLRTDCGFIDPKDAFGTTWVFLTYGGSSSQWVNPSLGQGRVLSPRLFNIVVNGAAVSAKRACPGVSLGPEFGAPRVSALLYADDIVLLAETAQELQNGLDAIAAWARRWRFIFSPGPEKSAVKVGNGPGNPFAECAAWAFRENLDLQWCDKLFRSYSLPAFLHGSEPAAVDSRAVALMNKSLRTWGRGLLGWPRGSLIAAVFGDLGWFDAEALALDRAASLCGRLRYRLFGVGPGAPLVVSRRWRRDAVLPALVSASHRRFLESARSVASLFAYLGAQLLPRLQRAVHNRWVPATDARFRGLERCGHHVFADGRISRHVGASSRCLFCSAPDGSLNHVLASCPACRDLRVLWCRRTGASLCNAVPYVAEPWVFNVSDVANSLAVVAAHIAFVAMVCRRGEDALRDPRAARQ
ncbi:unnamed protein product [Polarella glacialis]|uniref:Reverse transcriptase domain-containing protein n=1 Tax=Polarella glacialis TaxID=89957 RepID=A0A813DBL0_POLGL|nr:unnamed protein product [Polarella glacialis]